MLAALKQTALRVSKNAGVSAHIGRSAWRRRRLLILCYHGVSLEDEHQWDPKLYMSEATFARRLAAIRRHGCTVMPLGEAVARLYADDLPDRAVVLTFDDGFFDFKQRVCPVLLRHSFPATVYLTTQRCEHNFPIARLLASYVLWKQRHMILDGRGIAGLRPCTYSLLTSADRRRVLEGFCRALTSMRPTEKDAAVRELAARVELDYEALRAQRLLTLMNPAEVADSAAAGFDFQLHTHRHRTPEDPDVLVEELTLNRERITRMTGVTPRHFCYPSGQWRPSFLPRLREQGICSATTSTAALAEAADHALLLPRVLDSGTLSDDEFDAWLTGAAAWIPHPALA
jgi:peptidoglycan/xylan/chitin deacetylase (PgdA/CDA1 family)